MSDFFKSASLATILSVSSGIAMSDGTNNYGINPMDSVGDSWGLLEVFPNEGDKYSLGLENISFEQCEDIAKYSLNNPNNQISHLFCATADQENQQKTICISTSDGPIRETNLFEP